MVAMTSQRFGGGAAVGKADGKKKRLETTAYSAAAGAQLPAALYGVGAGMATTHAVRHAPKGKKLSTLGTAGKTALGPKGVKHFARAMRSRDSWILSGIGAVPAALAAHHITSTHQARLRDVGKAFSREDKATLGAAGGIGLAAGGAGLARYSTKRIKGAVVADVDARRALEAKRTAWRARDKSAKQQLAMARTRYGGRANDYDHFAGWQRGVGSPVRVVPDPADPARKVKIKRGDTAMVDAVHDMRAEQLRVAERRLDAANMRDVVAESRHRAASNAVAQFKGKAPKVQRTFGRLRRVGRAGAVLGVAGAGASLVAAERGRSRPKPTGNVPGYSAPRNEVNDRIAAARAEGDRYRAMGY